MVQWELCFFVWQKLESYRLGRLLGCLNTGWHRDIMSAVTTLQFRVIPTQLSTPREIPGALAVVKYPPLSPVIPFFLSRAGLVPAQSWPLNTRLFSSFFDSRAGL